MDNNQSGNFSVETKGNSKNTKMLITIVLSCIVVVAMLVLLGGFLFNKVLNISGKKGDSVAKFNKAYTAGIEVPDDAKDVRFISSTMWWSGRAEVAFTLEEDDFDDYLDNVNEKYTLSDWETDYGVTGLSVSDAKNVKASDGYNKESYVFELPNIDYEYMMVDDVDNYEVLYYKKETENRTIILASRESGRIYYYISAGG